MFDFFNIVYVIGIISIQLIKIESYSKKVDLVNGKSAFAYSNEIEIRCFSNDSKVLLSNSEEKFLFNLKRSDQILTSNEYNQIHWSDMIMMLHQHRSEQVLFYLIKLKSNDQISLTKSHLIPKRSLEGNIIYIPAEDIRLGDQLFIYQNGQLKHSLVEKIEYQIKKGYYAPLTMDGTLFVNQILVSCFSNIKSHSLGQFSMFPFRFFYRLSNSFSFFNSFNQILQTNENEQMPSIISFLFHWTFSYFPQLFLI